MARVESLISSALGLKPESVSQFIAALLLLVRPERRLITVSFSLRKPYKDAEDGRRHSAEGTKFVANEKNTPQRSASVISGPRKNF